MMINFEAIIYDLIWFIALIMIILVGIIFIVALFGVVVAVFRKEFWDRYGD